MDYVEGETLDDFLAEHGGEDLTQRHRDTEAQSGRARSPSGPPGGLPEADVLRILRPIAAALDYAHGEGVVHRDVKPGRRDAASERKDPDGVPSPSAGRRGAPPPQFFCSRRQDGGSPCYAAWKAAFPVSDRGTARVRPIPFRTVISPGTRTLVAALARRREIVYNTDNVCKHCFRR